MNEQITSPSQHVAGRGMVRHITAVSHDYPVRFSLLSTVCPLSFAMLRRVCYANRCCMSKGHPALLANHAVDFSEGIIMRRTFGLSISRLTEQQYVQASSTLTSSGGAVCTPLRGAKIIRPKQLFGLLLMVGWLCVPISAGARNAAVSCSSVFIQSLQEYRTVCSDGRYYATRYRPPFRDWETHQMSPSAPRKPPPLHRQPRPGAYQR
ncbi:MAG TPA: hypothetical protein VLK82_01790 [Candidatus Tectomicrobia bacterium]|nr:hypothetical protein [Candidatus Tectomicrobia bacterium]